MSKAINHQAPVVGAQETGVGGCTGGNGTSNKDTANCSEQISQHSDNNSPSRNNNNTPAFIENQIVWVKVKGHQIWPGYVSIIT